MAVMTERENSSKDRETAALSSGESKGVIILQSNGVAPGVEPGPVTIPTTSETSPPATGSGADDS